MTLASSDSSPRRLVLIVLGAVLAGAVLGGVAVYFTVHRGHEHGEQVVAKSDERYRCPMHPTVVQDHPGECPICGMQLMPVLGRSDAGIAAPPARGKIAFYRSPMDPKQTSPVPRKDEMGMDYLPVYEGELSGGAAPLEGLATVSIDPARQQLIGLRTAEVKRENIAGSWRTVGRVQVDPTGVRKINVKVEGYVEKVYVDFVGKSVRRGEALFSLYSPELLAAQNEYLLALRTRNALVNGGALAANGDALVSSARHKLEL